MIEQVICDQPLNVNCDEKFDFKVEIKEYPDDGYICIIIPDDLKCKFVESDDVVYYLDYSDAGGDTTIVDFSISLKCEVDYFDEIELPIQLCDLQWNIIDASSLILHLSCQ